MQIRELISRRTDLSTFLVHLTRDFDAESGRERLESIITMGSIKAMSAHGQARERVKNDPVALDSQRVVCFTETPLEHIHLLTADINDRQIRFAPYGVALTKRIARTHGINPVWYVDITPGHDWLTNPLNALIDQAVTTGDFANSEIGKIAPFIEQMGTQQGKYRKEFWWEREWRYRGDFRLPQRLIGICPATETAAFDAIAKNVGRQVAWIDSSWSLEEIIGRLAGFEPDEVSVIY